MRITSFKKYGVICLLALGLVTSLSKGVFSQESKANQVNFLRKSARPIKIATNDPSDLKALDKALKGKRIVLMGEFTHGSKEINLLKNRVIAHLHENLGFKVLLLESGIGEIYAANFLRDSLTNRQMLYAGVTGPWQTLEYLSLMEYLKVNKGLHAGGIDVQRTGGRFSAVFESIDPFISPDSAAARNVEKRYTVLAGRLNDRTYQFSEEDIKERDQLVSDYGNILKSIDKNRTKLEAAGWDRIKLETIKRTLKNRVDYIDIYVQYKKDGDVRKRYAARDTLMAENAIWFANHLYPREKIIVSAHNYHIARSNKKETVMGRILSDKFGDDLYSMGIFSGRGERAGNSRKAEKLAEPTSERDIQAIIDHIAGEAAFLEIPKKRRKGAEWLFENITVNHSFIDLDSGNQLLLNKSFDALILIGTSSLPEYAN